jgi:hypothetical protein
LHITAKWNLTNYTDKCGYQNKSEDRMHGKEKCNNHEIKILKNRMNRKILPISEGHILEMGNA